MPTDRLTIENKEYVRRCFSEVMRRSLHNVTDPLEKLVDEYHTEIYLECMGEENLAMYRKLKKAFPEMVQSSKRFRSVYVIQSGSFVYECRATSIHAVAAKVDIPETSAYYVPLLQYCERMHMLVQDYKQAVNWMGYCVNSCSSVGQLHRIVPEDFFLYVPQMLARSMSDAKRKSRIPRGYQEDDNNMQLFGKVLALGTLSPKESPVHTVEYSRRYNQQC